MIWMVVSLKTSMRISCTFDHSSLSKPQPENRKVTPHLTYLNKSTTKDMEQNVLIGLKNINLDLNGGLSKDLMDNIKDFWPFEFV